MLELQNIFTNLNPKLKISKFDDILCAFDGAPGRNNIGLVGAYSSGIYNLQTNIRNKGLVYFEINSQINKKIINEYCTGQTTILHSSKSIKYLKYALLNEDQKQFLNQLFKIILHNKRMIEKLINIKINLLNKYF